MWSPWITVVQGAAITPGSEFDLLSDHVPLVAKIEVKYHQTIEPQNFKWLIDNNHWDLFKEELELFLINNPYMANIFDSNYNILRSFLLG